MHPILQEIINKCGTLKIVEQRGSAEDSRDLVFSIYDREDVNKIFITIFGPPIKPTDAKPSPVHLVLTEKYGGIRRHQKLFLKRYDNNVTVIAMFRIWKRTAYFTVRLVVMSTAEVEKIKPTWNTALKAWVESLFDRFS